MKKLLITRVIPEAIVESARAHFDVTVRQSTEDMMPDEAAVALAGYDAILPTLGDQFTANAFGGDIRCGVLANFGVGYNHIDVAAAGAAGIVVTNTPGAVTDATADIGVMLMLMSARRAAEGERLVRSGQWEGWHPTQMLGLHMSGKRVGIVGMGRIGQAIAHRCHYGFGMSVHYFNRSAKQLQFPAQRAASLADLARMVDFVVVAVPGGAETHHFIGGHVFAAMQAHAHFINIARGDVVDETALIAALQSGQIAGAGLDVYEFEPKVPEALTALDTVTVLPHLGTAALEVRTAMGMVAVENLAAFLSGADVPNPV